MNGEDVTHCPEEVINISATKKTWTSTDGGGGGKEGDQYLIGKGKNEGEATTNFLNFIKKKEKKENWRSFIT